MVYYYPNNFLVKLNTGWPRPSLACRRTPSRRRRRWNSDRVVRFWTFFLIFFLPFLFPLSSFFHPSAIAVDDVVVVVVGICLSLKYEIFFLHKKTFKTLFFQKCQKSYFSFVLTLLSPPCVCRRWFVISPENRNSWTRSRTPWGSNSIKNSNL